MKAIFLQMAVIRRKIARKNTYVQSEARRDSRLVAM